MDEIFRKEALKRLQSPEQLDRLMEVSGPSGWIAVTAVTAVLGAALVWAVLGSLPTHVKGEGIMLQGAGGTQAVVANAAGTLREVLVKTNDTVRKGDIIARVTLFDTLQAERDAERQIAAITAERTQQESYYRTYIADQKRNLTIQRANLQTALRTAEAKIAAQRDILNGLERLLKDGYTTQIQVEQAREKLYQSQAERDQNRLDIAQLAAKELEFENERTRALQEIDTRLLDANARLADARDRRVTSGVLLSPVDGRVVLVEGEPNTTVNAGSALVTIEYGEPRIEVVAYVDAAEGKKAQHGMRVNVSPTTAKPEEYGTILGHVESVADFPATRESMMRVLNNDKLVEKMSTAGPPIAMRVSLQLNPATPSGFAWSSGTGPKKPVTTGTLAMVQITVAERAPITLIIPALKRFFGLYS